MYENDAAIDSERFYWGGHYLELSFRTPCSGETESSSGVSGPLPDYRFCGNDSQQLDQRVVINCTAWIFHGIPET